MGYSAHPNLIIGATAHSIFGDLIPEERQQERFNQLGKVIGRVIVRHEYLQAPNGYKFHVGSNAWDDQPGLDRISYRFANLFADDSYKWVHYSDYSSADLEQIIIGLNIGKRYDDGYNAAHASHELGGIGHIKNEVAEHLIKYYGYHKEIKLFAQIYHSY